jgi:hypothetical protein
MKLGLEACETSLRYLARAATRETCTISHGKRGVGVFCLGRARQDSVRTRRPQRTCTRLDVFAYTVRYQPKEDVIRHRNHTHHHPQSSSHYQLAFVMIITIASPPSSSLILTPKHKPPHQLHSHIPPSIPSPSTPSPHQSAGLVLHLHPQSHHHCDPQHQHARRPHLDYSQS